jgi:hypothetical protein
MRGGSVQLQPFIPEISELVRTGEISRHAIFRSELSKCGLGLAEQDTGQHRTGEGRVPEPGDQVVDVSDFAVASHYLIEKCCSRTLQTSNDGDRKRGHLHLFAEISLERRKMVVQRCEKSQLGLVNSVWLRSETILVVRHQAELLIYAQDLARKNFPIPLSPAWERAG